MKTMKTKIVTGDRKTTVSRDVIKKAVLKAKADREATELTKAKAMVKKHERTIKALEKTVAALDKRLGVMETFYTLLDARVSLHAKRMMPIIDRQTKLRSSVRKTTKLK